MEWPIDYLREVRNEEINRIACTLYSHDESGLTPVVLGLWPVLLHTSLSLSIDNVLARTGAHARSQLKTSPFPSTPSVKHLVSRVDMTALPLRQLVSRSLV